MKHVLAISIGPVQGFIAAARKTRDFWFGSEMLSEISRSVAQHLQSQGAELIFPPDSCVSDPEIPVANKVVVIVSNGDPSSLAIGARNAATDKLKCLGGAAEKKLSSAGVGSLVDTVMMRKQLEGFLEFYAAWWPMRDDESDYQEARKQADLLLAGRKALRDFNPACSVEGRPKSSLDGGLDTVLKDPKQWPDAVPGIFLGLGIKRTEQLDGMSLIKRIAEPKRFVSVARVAVDPLIRRLPNDTVNQLTGLAKALLGSDLVQEFKQGQFPHYDRFNYDTQLFYNDASHEKELSDDVRTKASEFYELVSRACKDENLGRPPAYFAVLAADGDRMGAAISSIADKDNHKKLSEALGSFAKNARSIVNDHFGAMVYSGGDDVLAFLPLDTALECAYRLNEAFRGKVSSLDLGENAPTLSCGISIAHFGEHLQNLVRWACEALHHAKRAGRNRLAVHVHTRTAGEYCVKAVHEWAPSFADSGWAKWIDYYLKEYIPFGFPFELRSLARELQGTSSSALSVLIPQEVSRIVARKRKGGSPVPANVAADISSCAGSKPESLSELADELIIARHIVPVKRLVSGGTKNP